MFLSFVVINTLTISIIIWLAPNPLSMGILILILALTSTIIISLTISSWICFLVFLIYIRGILVLFSYFVAITPNMPISSLALNIVISIVAPTLLLINILLRRAPPILTQPELYIRFLYSSYSAPMLIALALVLFYIIVIVVKLVSTIQGPLRPFR